MNLLLIVCDADTVWKLKLLPLLLFSRTELDSIDLLLYFIVLYLILFYLILLWFIFFDFIYFIFSRWIMLIYIEYCKDLGWFSIFIFIFLLADRQCSAGSCGQCNHCCRWKGVSKMGSKREWQNSCHGNHYHRKSGRLRWQSILKPQ